VIGLFEDKYALVGNKIKVADLNSHNLRQASKSSS
jgi:hypothetical protein